MFDELILLEEELGLEANASTEGDKRLDELDWLELGLDKNIRDVAMDELDWLEEEYGAELNTKLNPPVSELLEKALKLVELIPELLELLELLVVLDARQIFVNPLHAFVKQSSIDDMVSVSGFKVHVAAILYRSPSTNIKRNLI